MLVLPPKPPITLSTRLPGWRRAQVLKKYVIDVCDSLVRACREQFGAVLPEPAAIAAHFEAFTLEQAKAFCLMVHSGYGATLPVSGEWS